MNSKMNPKLKRILAWIGIILLVSMYVMTLVFALLGKEYAKQMVLASVSMTIIVPVLIYAMQLAFSIVSGKKDSSLPDGDEVKTVEGDEPEPEEDDEPESNSDSEENPSESDYNRITESTEDTKEDTK